MSLRRSALALLALTLAAGCGGAPSSDSPYFGLELFVDRAVADQLSAFQIIVLPEGKTRDCTEIQKTCLRQQVKPDEPLIIHGSNGNAGRSLRFSASLSGTGVTSQDVSIEVPVGRDYAIIIEALSKDSPPRFLGSSCDRIPEVNASGNAPFIASPMTLNAVDCDPTF